MSITDPGQLRDGLEALLRRDLIGPTDPDEEIVGRPESRYLVGVLHPAFTDQDPTQSDEALAATGDDDAPDAYAAYGGMKQSAIGLSYTTTVDSTPVAKVTFAEYTPPAEATASEATESPVGLDVAEHLPVGAGTRLKSTWKRVPAPGLTAALREPAGFLAAGDDIELRWQSRVHDGARIWTVSLVNRRHRKGARPIFQPSLQVTLEADGGEFVARPLAARSDPDARLSALLYRNEPEFAVGHGCAADWEQAGNRVASIRTEFIPSYDVPAVIPAEQTAAELDQALLSRMDDGARLDAALRPIVDEYRGWISEQANTVGDLPVALRGVAEANLNACRAAARRIETGIEAIAGDARTRDAFRFMNAAMALQRRRSLLSAEYRSTGIWPSEIAEIPKWRPFQLAFILMNLVGVMDPGSDDRQVVDLLWFPTGGGKTEAYLGLTAFTIGYRRLRESAGEINGQGITVLMRYTLRLLTTQQFERATALVSACEFIRRKAPAKWGTLPITIGLWVGQEATPNRYEQARAKRDELAGRPNANEQHPFVLRTCPWCGAALPFPQAFVFDDAARTVTVVCTQARCDFGAPAGLPVVLIDESVYRHPPSVLLATVDKFARMPWVPDAASLFGRATTRCPNHGYVADPEGHKVAGDSRKSFVPVDEGPGISLIIQDELHLISGPLGTLVGIYEVAVEFLAGRAGTTPKVIASTATIRSAMDQVRGLYGRGASLFPPPALDPFESFFARLATPEERPGRRFVGLAAPGSSMKTALIRVYASLLSGPLDLEDDPAVRDPYWTLVGYFNSIRELGGALSLMYDDVPKRLAASTRQDGRPLRELLLIAELTSRIPTYEIPNRLKQMEQPVESGKALDTLLASNMISVGIDVDRLGLMVVAGQPKGTAEYIQATSRVGRRHPGLIVTVYNWSRARDLSHYERFRSYHASLYRHVEATSVTPLSARARDRGLQAVLVAVLRLAQSRLRGNADAVAMKALDRTDPMIAEFLAYFGARALRTQSDEAHDSIEDLEASIDYWIGRASIEPGLTYEGVGTNPQHYLLRPALADDSFAGAPRVVDAQAWRLPNSLRNVEREHNWYRK